MLPRCVNCPTVAQIALSLLKQFKIDHPGIKIDCILADALYGTKDFLDEASAIFNGAQVISQIKKSQNIVHRSKKIAVELLCDNYPDRLTTITLSGFCGKGIGISNQNWKGMKCRDSESTSNRSGFICHQGMKVKRR